MDSDSSFSPSNAWPLLQQFDLRRVRDDLTRLSADAFAGRRVGTPGHDRAQAWLAARFAALGLETTMFKFTLDTSVLHLDATPTLVVTAPDGGIRHVLEHRRDFSEHPRTASRLETVTGIAENMAEVGGKNGRWAILTTVPQGEMFAALVDELADRGVLGLLTPQHPGRDGYLTKRIVSRSAVPLPVLAVRADLLPSLAQQWVHATVPVRPFFATGGHVLGRLAGTDSELDPAPLLIGAHYDGVGDDPARRIPAAADNAAGVAVVLELARLLLLADRPPQRPIIFAAFDAEEVNALGSRAYARALTEQHIRPLVLNLDGAARFHDAVWVEAGVGSEVLTTALDQVGRQLSIPLTMGPVGSDNRRFAGQGFPAVGLGLGGTAMHSPADVPEQVDNEALHLAGGMLLAAAWELAYQVLES